MTEREYKVTELLPNNGKRVMAFGHRTFCCECDMEKNPDWHEVVFSFRISSYKLKKEIPSHPEDSILESYEMLEHWDFDDEEPFDHLIGVTKWKKIND